MELIVDLSTLPLPENPELTLNPFHHDMDRVGTQINDRFVAMYHPITPNKLVIVDLATGERNELVYKEVPK